MPISNKDLAIVRDMISAGRAIPAVIVRGIVARLDRVEGARCERCRLAAAQSS